MLLQIPSVLNAEQLLYVRKRLDEAGNTWVDGRVTAGHQGVAVKRNQQIAEQSAAARELGDVILAALERNPLFISAALPNRVYPPLFNRYGAGMEFGNHVDGAVRMIPGSAQKMRTDISATLFLSAPEEYAGGELLIEGTHGTHSAKLSAGDMILYPASTVHRVMPVTEGMRIASFFWIESLVRDESQRTLLFDLDQSIQRLGVTQADETARVQLTGCYHNLLRMWASA